VEVDIPTQYTEWTMRRTRGEERPVSRSEHTLVLAYKAHLEAQGIAVRAARINVPGEGTYENDIWVPARRHLIEAKSAAQRDSVRMAIGQLADYGRAVPWEKRAVLLPHRPSSDLEELLARERIAVIWKEHDRFVDTSDGKFT
jgi:hypothetical protein